MGKNSPKAQTTTASFGPVQSEMDSAAAWTLVWWWRGRGRGRGRGSMR
jgi:hypothetical protein